MISINNKFRDCFLELKNASLKFNNIKPLKNRFNIMEDQLFASTTSFFERNGNLTRKDSSKTEINL